MSLVRTGHRAGPANDASLLAFRVSREFRAKVCGSAAPGATVSQAAGFLSIRGGPRDSCILSQEQGSPEDQTMILPGNTDQNAESRFCGLLDLEESARQTMAPLVRLRWLRIASPET